MKKQRIAQINDYITKHGIVSLNELSSAFHVSLNTIRRDVAELACANLIEKTHGGVCALTNPGPLITVEQRFVKNVEAKQAIGRLAAEYVMPNDIIYIDSGSTMQYMVPHLSDKDNVTIVTNSINVANNAMPYENLQVIMLPGQLNRAMRGFYGLSTISILNDINISKAFMAAAGVSLANGLTDGFIPGIELKKKVVEKCEKHYLLVDSSKFGLSTLKTFANLSDFEYVITEQKPLQEYLDYFSKQNISCVYE